MPTLQYRSPGSVTRTHAPNTSGVRVPGGLHYSEGRYPRPKGLSYWQLHPYLRRSLPVGRTAGGPVDCSTLAMLLQGHSHLHREPLPADTPPPPPAVRAWRSLLRGSGPHCRLSLYFPYLLTLEDSRPRGQTAGTECVQENRRLGILPTLAAHLMYIRPR